jgi:hypothetical protein
MDELKTTSSPPEHRATYWLIVTPGTDRPEALAVETFPGEQALAVFSFEEEARLFLFAQESTEGWVARKFAASELVSVLLDSRPARIALDPLPENLGGKLVGGLLSVSRERFLRGLVREWDPTVAHPYLIEGQEVKGGP